MIADYKYKDINQVMRGIRQQIIDSVEWCYNNVPVFDNPMELYNYFLPRITFVEDPKGVELLQTAQTLFENNYHGIPGAGDCDCFTILGTASFIAQGWGGIDIDLAGRNKWNAVHIYNEIKFDGEYYVFDLTEKRFNKERYYPYKQILPIYFNN